MLSILQHYPTVTSRAVYEYLFGTNDGDENNPPSREPVKRGGKTILDSLKEDIQTSVSEINKLQAPGGEVTEGMIKIAAMEKFGAFDFLIKTGDENTEEGLQQGTVFDLLEFTDRIEGTGNGSENTDGDNTDKDDKDIDAVRIMTCHGWKGLECDTMFVPCGLMWPRGDTTTPLTKQEIIDEVGGDTDALRGLLVKREEMESERRLMYVAMTRAEQTLHLIHTKSSFKEGKVILGSHFFESGEICMQPTNKQSNLLENWGDTMVDGE